MTVEEFEAGYAERSGMTVERLRSLGLIARPCGCGEDGCNGWKMITKRSADDEDDHEATADAVVHGRSFGPDDMGELAELMTGRESRVSFERCTFKYIDFRNLPDNAEFGWCDFSRCVMQSITFTRASMATVASAGTSDEIAEPTIVG